MAGTVYEFISTKNARLAKFTDENPDMAKLFMKIINHLEQMSREKRKDVGSLECHASPDGTMIFIKVTMG